MHSTFGAKKHAQNFAYKHYVSQFNKKNFFLTISTDITV